MKLCCATVLLAYAVAARLQGRSANTGHANALQLHSVSTSQAPSAAGGTFNLIVTKSSGSLHVVGHSNASWLNLQRRAAGADTATSPSCGQRHDVGASRRHRPDMEWRDRQHRSLSTRAALALGDCRYTFASPTQTVPSPTAASRQRR